MKKNYKLIILMFVLVPILFASCASKQKAKDIPPEPKVEDVKTSDVEQEGAETDPILAKLKLFQGEDGKVNQVRKRAIELGADEAYPDFFNAADDVKQKADTDVAAGNLKEAIAKYEEAVSRYETLINLTEASKLRT